MSSVRRRFFAVLFSLSILLVICVWYSESHLSRLSVVTTVHSYIYASTLNSLEADSEVKEDLHEIRQLKTSLEDFIKQYSKDTSRLNSAATLNKSRASLSVLDSVYSHQQLITESKDRASAVTYPSQSTVLMAAEENTKLSVGSARPPILTTDIQLSEAVSSRKSTTRELVDTSTEAKPNVPSEGFSRNESDTDFLVRSLLLQALMNETGDNIIKKPKSLHLDESLVVKPGCERTGNFPSEESKNIWLNFKQSLETYTDFHNEQLQQLKAGNNSVRTLTWSCHDPVKCAGIGDQFYRIQQALIFAIAFNRVLFLHWNPASYETTKYLRPNKIDWTYFNKSLGMHEYHENELSKVKVRMDTVEEFELLYKLLANENRTHVTVNHEVEVPFLRGMLKAIRRHTGMNAAIKRTGFTALITDKKHMLPMNFLSGELLRYLFHFRGNVVDKVDQIQQQLGIADKPYLALHMRTGFLGMKHEEIGLSPKKVFRSPSDWEKSLSCSVKLSRRLFGPETSLFLATDSRRVKETAVEKYNERFVTINVTLQHVAFTEMKKILENPEFQDNKHATTSLAEPTPVTVNPVLNIDGVDGYMATWIEFLLLARASAMVHSISGFSTTAAYFCSMHNQYRVPNCK